MIKNIIFDMGNVILEYNPREIIRHFTQEEKKIEKAYQIIFESEEWLLADAGKIDLEEQRDILAEKMGDDKELSNAILEHWYEYCLPVKGIEDLILQLKNKGYPLYLFSNTSEMFYRFQNRKVFTYFNGFLISAEEKYIKPQKEIYERLFKKFNLIPEECIFIDDNPRNIEMGKKLGMNGYVFSNHDVEALKQYMQTVGIL